VLARRYGDFAAAEDAVQEALIAASERWPTDGIPESPRAWLLQTATRRLVDQYRSDQSRRRREREAVAAACQTQDVSARDDTLSVLFMSCHAALTPASAIALTLRAVGGLTTAEVARAFLVDEATMAQRISRAKRTIRAAGGEFGLPAPDEQAAALSNVLHVLYLIFNEGYTVQRAELSQEAIRLARILHGLLPDDSEVSGLLALMLLLEARRPARTAADGDLIPLPEQDRRLWDRAQIAEGLALLDAAIGAGAVGEYQIQAAIAAVHARAARADETDWPQILALYGLLARMSDNPVVTLNRAVALAMVEGPEAALELVQQVAERLAGNYRVDAVRAHLCEQAGDLEAAREHYGAAARRTTNLQEQRYLTARAASCAPRAAAARP
jgi:RNA polymerase sigma factor (sigma-70 family)